MRAIERDYLATFADKINLSEWGQIVDKALELAKEGDPKAREWVTRLVLTQQPLTLSDLARREFSGVTSGDEVGATIAYAHTSWMARPEQVDSPLELAEHPKLLALEAQRELATKAQARAAREQRKAERAARKAEQIAPSGAGE